MKQALGDHSCSQLLLTWMSLMAEGPQCHSPWHASSKHHETQPLSICSSRHHTLALGVGSGWWHDTRQAPKNGDVRLLGSNLREEMWSRLTWHPLIFDPMPTLCDSLPHVPTMTLLGISQQDFMSVDKLLRNNVGYLRIQEWHLPLHGVLKPGVTPFLR